jgi:hypothetical protein
MTSSYKIPDIEVFKGKGGKEDNYRQWKITARDKLRTIPEEHRCGYLRRFVKDFAWDVIQSIETNDVEVLLHELDEVFDAIDKRAEAETKLFDGSLAQKYAEPFNEWFARYVGVIRQLKLDDRSQVTHAYRLMRHNLSTALLNASSSTETLSQLATRARVLEQRQTDINIGRHLPKPTERKTTSSLPTKRTSAQMSTQPNTPNRRRGIQVAFDRTDEERAYMRKHLMCFKCGKKGCNAKTCPSRQPVPSKDIPELRFAAMEAEEEDLYNYEVDEDGYIVEPGDNSGGEGSDDSNELN